MGNRITDRDVNEMFRVWLRAVGGTEGYEKGTYSIGGAYGRVNVEYNMENGGARDVTGFLTKRELYDWLRAGAESVREREQNVRARVVLDMDGGLLQDIRSDHNVDVLLRDYDLNATDEPERHVADRQDRTYYGIAYVVDKVEPEDRDTFTVDFADGWERL